MLHPESSSFRKRDSSFRWGSVTAVAFFSLLPVSVLACVCHDVTHCLFSIESAFAHLRRVALIETGYKCGPSLSGEREETSQPAIKLLSFL